jgi:mono/diheme cytochrome c family protein
MGFEALMRNGLLLLLALSLASAQHQNAFFESKIRPILANNCYACHSAQIKAPMANLRLDSRAAMLKGGDHGPVLVPYNSAASLLLTALRYKTLRMPPAGKLPDDQIANIEQWIASGAHWPDDSAPAARIEADTSATKHWAWQPLRRDFPPDTSIDSLVSARLEEKNLALSPPANPHTLRRRTSYDLTGLPPSGSQESYEESVDRLLASPHFGERWARHWLDLARFSDAGFNNIRFPFSHTYRDWLIEAYNRDLPYGDFIVNQLAADLVPSNTPANLRALGFLSLGFDPHRPSGVPDKIDDRIDAVTRTFLALTVACARCHDHKYDPIPTADYYSLYGVFLNTREPIVPRALTPAPLPPAAQRRLDQLEAYKSQRILEHRADARHPDTVKRYIQAALDALNLPASQIDPLSKERNLNLYLLRRWRDFAAAQNSTTPESILAAWIRIRKTAQDPTEIPLDDFAEVQTEGDYNTTNNVLWEYKRVLADHAWRGGPPRAMHVEDSPSPQSAYILIRGNATDPGPAVDRHFVSLLDKECKPFSSGSGRLDLARAIANPDNPLTARVYVNRIWQHLFGEGLVRTVSDFGTRGDPPTHPELLDYLAHTFLQDGGSTKKLIRRILLSRTYRQSSALNPQAAAIDPENRLLWRMNRRRLDFESLRDSILAAAGTLDPKIGGVSFSLGAVPADPRRTLYAFQERERAQALLKSFNYADPEQHTPQRHLTTVPQQALFLLNSPFLAEQARHLAGRSSTVKALYQNALGRDPSPTEIAGAEAFLHHSPSQPPPSPDPNPWSYGTAAFSPDTAKVQFRPFRYFNDDAWQAASQRPHPTEGNARLTATGGHPGDNLNHAVIRRFTAPAGMTVNITGTLTLPLDQFERRFGFTNGIRAWILHSRLGVLARHELRPQPGEVKDNTPAPKADTSMNNIELRAGDTIDFIVDSLDDPESDEFTWSPALETKDGKKFSAALDFQGPASHPLTRWEQLAQVILLTNEFAFID